MDRRCVFVCARKRVSLFPHYFLLAAEAKMDFLNITYQTSKNHHILKIFVKFLTGR